MDWTRDAAFFYQLLKPGRYIGGEIGLPPRRDLPSQRDIVWFYPDRYERAVADPAWRRSYFQISQEPGIHVSRAVEYARDVWQSLAASHRPAFTLDSLSDMRSAETVVFWAPDLFAAAHIPSIMCRSGLDCASPSIGVLCDGYWIPRFLVGHVDWVAPARGGWLSGGLVELLRGGGKSSEDVLSARSTASVEGRAGAWKPGSLLPSHPASTPRWVPLIEAEDDYVDVDLANVDEHGVLRMRDLPAVVLDALDGLRTTGVDSLRFCNGANSSSELLAATLSELQRRHNMKRVRVHCPAISTDQFLQDWLSYRPHLLKPRMRFRFGEVSDPGQAIDVGNRALNVGWQGLSAVLEFDSFDSLMRLLPRAQQVIEGWDRAAQGHADKHPLRLEYEPAPIGVWRDAPDGPEDDSARRYSNEMRQFKEGLAGIAAVGTFRIEEIMARNWLAATDVDLWDRLAGLDLSDPNDPEAPTFDWFNWVRQEAGLAAPPKSDYVVIEAPDPAPMPAQLISYMSKPAPALDAPSDSLFGRRKQKSLPSRRLAAPSLMRMRVKWAKEMPWRLYSHLDLVRAIERAIRKAGLPGAYSEGFHPRLKLSFGPPLSFGLLSDGEYFDLILDEDCQASHVDKLSRSMPAGLPLVQAHGMAAGMPALSDVLNDAAYSALIPLEHAVAQAKLDEFHARSKVSWQRIGREDRRPVDPRKTLRGVSVEPTGDGTRWELNVGLGGEGNIRPTEWAMLLFGFVPEQMGDIIIRRVALNVRRGMSVRSPFEMV